jgi:hypothetical protein
VAVDPGATEDGDMVTVVVAIGGTVAAEAAVGSPVPPQAEATRSMARARLAPGFVMLWIAGSDLGSRPLVTPGGADSRVDS